MKIKFTKERAIKIDKEKEKIEKLLKLTKLSEINDEDNPTYTFSSLNFQQVKLVHLIILDGYLQIDAKMSILINDFFFDYCQNDYDRVEEISNSNKFKVFQKKVLNQMPFLRKVSILKEHMKLSKEIIKIIEKINDLRNAITHSLVPKNLGVERATYKKKSIYEIDTAEKISEDIDSVMKILQKKFVLSFDEK